ncbi:MAG TPA: hypothetical protein VL362_01415 [Patescibacteria group bacterium]|jgi:hypothetical protein|nr:hypothetical protein [Patescibacteria group bacterium]
MPTFQRLSISKKYLLLCIGLLVVIAIASTLFMVFGTRAPGSSLAPKEQLKVGDNRLINACQVLPESAAIAAFGSEGDTSYIRETYLQSSVSADNLEKASFGTIDTTCHYYFEDKANKAITLTVDQYKDSKSATEQWQTAVKLGDGTYDRMLANFQKTLAKDPSANTEASRELVAFMKESLPKAKREAGKSVDGLDKSIIFNKNRSEFLAVYKNTVLTLKYEAGSANPFDSRRSLDSTELAGVLGPVQKALDAAFTNLDNAKLSQAPSPTLRNAVTKVGKTAILEPCEVLDAATFETIFGKQNNDPVVERSTTTLTPNKQRTHADGYPILDGNDCQRSYNAKLAGESGKLRSGYVLLELRYAPDGDTAAKNLTGVVRSLSDNFTSKDFKKLTNTSADLAYARNTKHGTLLVQSVRFQKDGYVGAITVTKLDDMAENIDVPEADFVKAVDTIVSRLP